MNRLLKSFFGLTLGVAFSLGVAASLNSNKKAVTNTVEAATPSSYTNVYRFTVPHDFGSDVGNHIYLHAWGSSGGDTSWGNFITLSDYSYNENSERMYTYATNYTYTGFIIIRYSDNPDYCKTADITVGSAKAWSWNGTNGASASAWAVTNQTYYFYDYRNLLEGTAKCHAWQSNGSLNNGNYGDVTMTPVQYGSGQLYSITLDPAFDEFIVGKDDTTKTSDEFINQNRGHCYCWWGDNPGWSDNLDWVKAHDWIYNTMHVRDITTETTTDTGACRGSSGYYKKAKTAYQNYSAAIKTKISEDACWDIAQARFSAWAKANGETASFSGTILTISSARSFVPFSLSGDNNTIIVLVAICSLGILSVGAYFFFKKSKKAEE